MSFGASVGIMTFFTTLKKRREREEFLELQIFSLAAFNKQLLTAFLCMEGAAFSQWSQ